MGARKFTAHEGLNPALPGPLRVSPRQQRVICCSAQPRRRTATLLLLGMRSMVWWRWKGGLTVLPCRVYDRVVCFNAQTSQVVLDRWAERQLGSKVRRRVRATASCIACCLSGSRRGLSSVAV